MLKLGYREDALMSCLDSPENVLVNMPPNDFKRRGDEPWICVLGVCVC